MTDLLFATPWWLMAAVIIVGVTLFLSGNKRQQTGLRNAGGGIVLAAVALLVVSHFVETDKEKASRFSREVITAVQDRDWAKMTSLLDPKASLATVIGTVYKNRDELVKGAQDAAERYALKSVYVRSMDVKQDEAGITIDLDVFSVQGETMDRPAPSSWRFEWIKTNGGWKLYRITCLKIVDQNAGRIRQLIGH